MMRREFLLSSASAINLAPPGRLPIRKAVLSTMLPTALSWADRFKLARDVGFEEVECPTTEDPSEAEEMKNSCESAGLRIHSVMDRSHRYPLSSPDPAVVAKGIQFLKITLGNARLWKAETILLIPGIVDAKNGYRDVWTRSQREIRRILPLAEEMKVVIAIENVGFNHFLISPLEFARYVDEMDSPWFRAYFDVGNVLRYGFPQDWIRTLGKRIVKLHLKDPRVKSTPGEPAPRLLEGDVDWREVHKAVNEIGYHGSATVELAAGDEEYLRDVSRRVDRILDGV